MRWVKASLAAALAALLFLWGFYYASPRWTLHKMREAALAHDLEALSAYVDYPALWASVEAQRRSEDSGLLAMAPPEVRDRVEADVSRRRRAREADPDPDPEPEFLRLIFGREPTYWGWASGSGTSGRHDVIVVRGPDEFELHDLDAPYPDPAGDLVFRRYGLGWKLVSMAAIWNEFPEEPPKGWWARRWGL